jgi:CO/xanthine dehydrogenase Mo-binding subunit
MDPLELRLKNIRTKGEILVDGELPVDGDWAGVLKMAADAVGWNTPKPEGCGRGIAFGMKSSIPASASSARVSLNSDGSAAVFVGTTEMGQGTRTTMSLIVSRALDIPLEKISIRIGDTAVVPFDTITASSRSVVAMGTALEAACRDIQRQLREMAVEVFGVEMRYVLCDGCKVSIRGRDIGLADLMSQKLGPYRSEIAGQGSYQGKADASHPLGGPAPFFEAVATAVELHVDMESGQIFLDKLVHATDVGKVINPIRAAGVDEGGNIMGVGLALSEQLLFDASGAIINGSSLDYRIPTVSDVPEQMISLFQENRDGPGPQGAKGLGEGGILAVAPAICGALFDCTGILLTEIPFTPERVWRALGKRDR